MQLLIYIYSCMLDLILLLVVAVAAAIMLFIYFRPRPRIIDRLEDPSRAAALMDEITQRIVLLLKYVKHKYGDGKDAPITEYDHAILRALRGYNPDNLFENHPHNISGDTSYTINKGKKMAICLRDKETLQLHDINTMMFVVLHELAHIASESVGHSDNEFWRNFKFILQNAAECGIYHVEDYSIHPMRYCGMTVTYNPLFDMSL